MGAFAGGLSGGYFKGEENKRADQAMGIAQAREGRAQDEYERTQEWLKGDVADALHRHGYTDLSQFLRSASDTARGAAEPQPTLSQPAQDASIDAPAPPAMQPNAPIPSISKLTARGMTMKKPGPVDPNAPSYGS